MMTGDRPVPVLTGLLAVVAVPAKLLYVDGRDQFRTLAALKQRLIGRGDISGYTVSSVSDGSFRGHPRKEVTVEVQLTGGGGRSLTLSMARKAGDYLVCGF